MEVSHFRFRNNGLPPLAGTPEDRKRELVTGNPSDRAKFAVPSLRNVALTAPYMHDGRFSNLDQVLDHYSSGIHPSPTLDPNLAKHPKGGIPPGKEDREAIIAFLQSLTDPQFVQAPDNGE